MSQVTGTWKTAIAGLALAGLPALLGAQSTTKTQYPAGGAAQKSAAAPADQNSPEHHLSQAKRVLDSINPRGLAGTARSQISQIQTEFNGLGTAWHLSAGQSASSSSTGETSATGTTGSTTGGTQITPRSSGASAIASSRTDWQQHYETIGSILDQLIGPDTSSSSRSTIGTAGSSAGSSAAGTSGASASELDAATRSKLTDFRRHLDLFHAAAIGRASIREEEATTAISGTTGTTTLTETAETTRPTSVTGTSPSTPTTPTTTTSETTTTSAPAAIDDATIARLTDEIDAILGGAETTAASATGTTDTTGTTTGTTGMAGTATASISPPASSGTLCVDRAKLEQLKRDLEGLRTRRQ
jgi:hypothetical protein